MSKKNTAKAQFHAGQPKKKNGSYPGPDKEASPSETQTDVMDAPTETDVMDAMPQCPGPDPDFSQGTTGPTDLEKEIANTFGATEAKISGDNGCEPETKMQEAPREKLEQMARTGIAPGTPDTPAPAKKRTRFQPPIHIIVEREKTKAILPEKLETMQPWDHLVLTTDPGSLTYWKQTISAMRPDPRFEVVKSSEGICVIRKP